MTSTIEIATETVSGRLWYHGTRSQFEQFDAAHLGACVKNPTTALGFYFTSDPRNASYWATYKGLTVGSTGAHVLIAQLDCKNPFVIDATRFQYLLQRAQRRTIEKLRREAEAHGHDGFLIRREDGQDWCAVFRPEQIRFAYEHPRPRLRMR